MVWRGRLALRGARRRARRRVPRVNGAGHGLVGMRERVELHGGELHAGARAGRRLRGRARELPRVTTRRCSPTTRRWCGPGFRLILELGRLRRRRRGRRRARGARAGPAAGARCRADGRADAAAWTGSRRRGGSGCAGLRTRVLVLTTFDMDEHVYDALRAGASGFLLKDAGRERLIEGVRIVAAGESLFAPSVLRRLVDHYVARPPARPRRRGLGGALRARARGAAADRPRPVQHRDRRGARSSRARPSRPTSATCWPSSACATACRPSCWPTSPGWCPPAADAPFPVNRRSGMPPDTRTAP